MWSFRIVRIMRFSIYLWFIAFECSAQTERKYPIDVAYNKCLSNDTTCGNISTCAFISYSKWDKEMEQAYIKLLKILKKEKDKAALTQSQTAWKAYRDATFKSYDNMFDLNGNKWCRLRHDYQIAIVRARALQLKNYFEVLKK